MMVWRLTWISRLIACCMVAVMACTTLAPVVAAAPAPRRALVGSATATRGEDVTPSAGQLAPMTSAEEQGFGCLATGGLAMGLSAFAGYDELVLVFAGGSALPTTTVGHVVAVAGMIFASFCAVGAIATPALVRIWQQYNAAEAPPDR